RADRSTAGGGGEGARRHHPLGLLAYPHAPARAGDSGGIALGHGADDRDVRADVLDRRSRLSNPGGGALLRGVCGWSTGVAVGGRNGHGVHDVHPALVARRAAVREPDAARLACSRSTALSRPDRWRATTLKAVAEPATKFFQLGRSGSNGLTGLVRRTNLRTCLGRSRFRWRLGLGALVSGSA